MGLFSSSSKSSTTSNQFDERVGAEGGSIVARDQGSISLDTPEAFELAESSVNNSLDFGRGALQTVSDVIFSSFETVIETVEGSNEKVQESANNSLLFADSFTRSESANLTNSIISMIPWAIGGMIAIVYIKGR